MQPPMNSPRELAAYLERTVATELPNLRAIPDGPETAAPNRPSGEGWSQREELGHLVDSAVNNHARFVRATLEPTYAGPGYDQEGWVAVHRYQEIPWKELVDVWHAHNRILLRLIAAIPPAKLATPCRVGGVGAGLVTLGFMIDDYVLHMQHHLDNVLRRSPPTKYPR
jgi:DinB family protein